MTARWATEHGLAHALEHFALEYPGETIEIIETFEIAWQGWEGDSQGVIITRNGVPHIDIVDRTIGSEIDLAEVLRERVADYRRLIAETEHVLERYERMTE